MWRELYVYECMSMDMCRRYFSLSLSLSYKCVGPLYGSLFFSLSFPLLQVCWSFIWLFFKCGYQCVDFMIFFFFPLRSSVWSSFLPNLASPRVGRPWRGWHSSRGRCSQFGSEASPLCISHDHIGSWPSELGLVQSWPTHGAFPLHEASSLSHPILRRLVLSNPSHKCSVNCFLLCNFSSTSSICLSKLFVLFAMEVYQQL